VRLSVDFTDPETKPKELERKAMSAMYVLLTIVLMSISNGSRRVRCL